jgi:CheY-like chemotaxis protein
MAQTSLPQSCTILIVENEAMVRLELGDQLVETGYRMLVACDADEAIELLDDHSEIALLITDITVPGSMDSVRLAHHVRDRWPPVRIIVTSGMTATATSGLPAAGSSPERSPR